MTLNKLVLCGVVALSTVAHGSKANAFGWRHHGSSGGSWGGSSGGSWGGSSGGSWGGSWGGHRHHHRLFHRHHGSGGSWGGSSGGSWGGGSSGGSWGGGSSGGSSGGWSGSSGGSSGGWSGSSGGWGSSGGSSGEGVIMEGAPVEGTIVPDGAPIDGATTPVPPPPDGSTTYIPDARSVVLTVEVPADATVFVNDYQTTSTGTVRRFVSRDLKVGGSYTFEIRSEITRDGEKVTRNKVVTVRAGETANLAFDFSKDADAVAQADQRTSLTLHVPADARVFLAGNETASQGEIRTFATSKLAGDTAWTSYPVRVELERDGQTLVKETMVTLKPGDNQELAFEFNDDQLTLVASK